LIDLAFTALDLKYPLAVEAFGPRAHPESAPPWLICKWIFPARGRLPPVELTWYDGNQRPALQKQHNMPDFAEGVLFVGSEGMLIADWGNFKLYPEDKFTGLRRPSLPPAPSHMEQFLAACRTGSETGCCFEYAGPLTETVLLGTVAHRMGRRLEWDAEKLRVTNCPEANALLGRANRAGWTL